MSLAQGKEMQKARIMSTKLFHA